MRADVTVAGQPVYTTLYIPSSRGAEQGVDLAEHFVTSELLSCVSQLRIKCRLHNLLRHCFVAFLDTYNSVRWLRRFGSRHF